MSSVNDSEQALLNLDNSIREKRPVDLLLVDWHTPNLEGIDLLKFVKGNDLLKIIPFIMITADGEKDHVQEAIIYGVDDYIVKPVIARLLISKIWKIMEAKYSI